MRESRYLGLIPLELFDAHAPLKVQMPDNIEPCCDSWMGHAINPLAKKTLVPFGSLYYLFWAQKFSELYNSRHCALVVDEPLLHDGVCADSIIDKGQQKTRLLEKIVEGHSLDRIDIISWDIFMDDTGYNAQYMEIKDDLIGFLDRSPEFKQELIQKTVPVQYRNNPRSYLYVVDEIVAILYMTAMGNQYRLGHLNERKLDRCVKRLYRSCDLGFPTPGVIYLQGDYPLDANDKHDVLPPSKEHIPKRRILLSDEIWQIREKIEGSTKFFRGWIKKTLDLGGYCSNFDKDDLSDAVYELLIKPLR